MKRRTSTICGLTLSFAACFACGADEDRLINPPAQTPAQQTPDQQDPSDDTANDDDGDLGDPDQLTSGDDDMTGDDEEPAGSCSDCPTPASGASCCTSADDVSAIRATNAGACGIDMSEFGFPGCTQLNQPGVLDESCPPVEFPPGAPPMPGCCTAAGHCGAMETFMGFGCTSNPDSSTWVACGS